MGHALHWKIDEMMLTMLGMSRGCGTIGETKSGVRYVVFTADIKVNVEFMETFKEKT